MKILMYKSMTAENISDFGCLVKVSPKIISLHGFLKKKIVNQEIDDIFGLHYHFAPSMLRIMPQSTTIKR